MIYEAIITERETMRRQQDWPTYFKKIFETSNNDEISRPNIYLLIRLIVKIVVTISLHFMGFFPDSRTKYFHKIQT